MILNYLDFINSKKSFQNPNIKVISSPSPIARYGSGNPFSNIRWKNRQTYIKTHITIVYIDKRFNALAACYLTKILYLVGLIENHPKPVKRFNKYINKFICRTMIKLPNLFPDYFKKYKEITCRPLKWRFIFQRSIWVEVFQMANTLT